MTNRIKYALHLNDWSFDDGDIELLMARAEHVLPTEFQEDMAGKIFCPLCHTNLSRSPKDRDVFSNNRKARFNHIPTYRHISCDLRTKQASGKTYHNVELARQAIGNDELAIVHSFQTHPPARVPDDDGVYDQGVIEDTDGPMTDAPISRHTGETFRVPSKITTVAGICRNFDRNLYKYYLLPGGNTAFLLVSLLIDIKTVTEVDEVPKLYWGRITSSSGMGPGPQNLRMTELSCNRAVKDFNIKAIREDQERKGINDNSIGRIVLFWGAITMNGIGLCVNRPTWGEYAVLPERYDGFIRDRP